MFCSCGVIGNGTWVTREVSPMWLRDVGIGVGVAVFSRGGGGFVLDFIVCRGKGLPLLEASGAMSTDGRRSSENVGDESLPAVVASIGAEEKFDLNRFLDGDDESVDCLVSFVDNDDDDGLRLVLLLPRLGGGGSLGLR